MYQEKESMNQRVSRDGVYMFLILTYLQPENTLRCASLLHSHIAIFLFIFLLTDIIGTNLC